MKAFHLRVSAVATKILMSAMVVLLCFGVSFAQSNSSAADLSGTVVDQNGAVVPGATVTVKDSATGLTRTATADESGAYRFIGLPPSDYEITVEAASFKKAVITPVKLTVGQNAELEIKLEAGRPKLEDGKTEDRRRKTEENNKCVNNQTTNQTIQTH